MMKSFNINLGILVFWCVVFLQIHESEAEGEIDFSIYMFLNIYIYIHVYTYMYILTSGLP